MIANYHTHTWRCGHASGTEREYVENAIAGGLKILGFSDHTPMVYDGKYVSSTKMSLEQLEDYVDTVLALKKEYQKDIEIHLGLEMEYYPKYFEKILAIIRQYPIEYFLLGQHFLNNEIGDFFSGIQTGDEARLEQYYKETAEALETGLFTYFAHPDLLHYVGSPEVYDKWMRQLCRHAKKLDIPLEINFLGIWSNRHYPNERFWEIVGEEGNTVVFGSDAHAPERVWDVETLSVAEEMVKKHHLRLTDTVTLHIV